MRITWRDWTATVVVAVAALMYAVWRSEGEVLGISSPRMMGLTVLVLGMAASATAVVSGVGEGLLKANKLYLAITSLIGLVAFAAGIVVLVNESEDWLAALVASTVVLWAISTVRHAMLGRTLGRQAPTAGATAA